MFNASVNKSKKKQLPHAFLHPTTNGTPSTNNHTQAQADANQKPERKIMILLYELVSTNKNYSFISLKLQIPKESSARFLVSRLTLKC